MGAAAAVADADRKGPAEARPNNPAGSGFFISADGYIVTNNHVVENAETIKVVLKDETELDAVVVGRDEPSDLAVIKVKGGRANFPFVNFENAGKPRVGDWVIAVEQPLRPGRHRPRPGSSAPMAATSATTSSTTSRSTPPSTGAIPAARPSTSMAASSA